MNQQQVHRVLNHLIAQQHRSLFCRLVESTIFASSANSAALEFVRETAGEHCRQQGKLIDLLVRLGGEPAPAKGDITSADLHFVNMDVLWPRIHARQQDLTDQFARAASGLDNWPEVLLLIREIADRHRACAEFVRKFCPESVA